MANKRSYEDPCGIARALDIVGERWALLVVRELVLGPKRFTDLRTGLPHVGPDVLSQRLRELEQAGILRRGTLPPPAGSKVYELTNRGRGLEPVILALGRWGSRAPFPATDASLSVDAFMIALKTVFDPVAANGLDATFQLVIAEQPFVVTVGGGRLDIVRGTATAPVATIESDPVALSRVLWHGESLAAALESGRVQIGGNRDQAERLIALFSALPAAAVA